MSSARDEKLNKGRRGTAAAGAHVSEDDIADLVGQLERYAENKTGKGKGTGNGFGGTNNANKPSAAGKKVRGLCTVHPAFHFILQHSYSSSYAHYHPFYPELFLPLFSPNLCGDFTTFPTPQLASRVTNSLTLFFLSLSLILSVRFCLFVSP